VRIGDDVVQFGNDGSRVLAEGCWTEAVGFESPVVVLRCEDERRVIMPADPSPIDVAWIALLRDDQWVTAEWRDDDARVSMGERAWTREGDAWVSRTDAPSTPCPVLALGQDRRALVLGAVEAPSCGYLAPQRFAWTDPISPDLCATPPRLGSYRDR
jgi:hypothetical protein